MMGAFIRNLGGLWFCVMVAGLSSFTENSDPWALLLGVSGAALTLWSGAWGTGELDCAVQEGQNHD